MRKPCLGLILAGVILGMTLWASAASPADFTVVSYDADSDGTVDLPGQLYVPEGYSPTGAGASLVLFMHGVGESGTNNTSQIGSNINNLISAAAANGFLVYAPQSSHGWSVSEVTKAMNVVAELTKTYNVDTSRIVSTGLSMGGAGCWETTSLYRDVLSASIPICGALNYCSYDELGAAQAGDMAGQPIWTFHATNDTTVPVSQTRDMVNAIAATEGQTAITFDGAHTGETYQYEVGTVKYTEYGSGGHSVWGAAYNTPELYTWMLSQSTPLAQPGAGQTVSFDLGNTQVNQDSQGRVWNGTLDDSESTEYVTAAFAKASDGGRTGISLGVVGAFDGVSGNGLTSGSAYDADIAADGWYTASQGILELTGLTPGGAYRVEVFGSTNDVAGALTEYGINSESVELATLGNLTDLAVFESVLADADGSLRIAVAPGSGSTYGYISSVEVARVPEPATMSLLAVGGVLVVRRNRRAKNRTERALRTGRENVRRRLTGLGMELLR